MDFNVFSAEELYQLEQLEILGGNVNPLSTQGDCVKGVCSQSECTQEKCTQMECKDPDPTPQYGCAIVIPHNQCYTCNIWG